MSKIKVVELFAGVGGFRVGLEGFPKNKNAKYEVVWSNQWEPASPKHLQHANWVYRYHFGAHKKAYKHSIHSEVNIKKVNPKDIPSHHMERNMLQSKDIYRKNACKT